MPNSQLDLLLLTVLEKDIITTFPGAPGNHSAVAACAMPISSNA